MKRILVTLFAFLLVMTSLVSCNSTQAPASLPQTPKTTQSAPPTSTAVPTSSTVPPTSTVPPATNNGEEAWGSGPTAANTPYDMDFSAVAEYMWDELEEFDPEKYRAWRAEFDDWGDYSKSSDKRDFRDCNLYTFFKEFNITKQQALDEMEEFRQKYTAYLIKNEKVEVVFSDMSEEEIYLYFASPSSVTVGKYAYPAEFFLKNTFEQYKLHGISIEAIEEKLPLLVGVYPGNYGKGIETIIKHLAEYKESEGVLEYSATPFEGKEHVTAAYLCEIGSEKWADEGITKEMIEDNLFDLLYTCETAYQMRQIVDGADLWCSW